MFDTTGQKRPLARTVRLDRDIDLLDVAGHDGILFTKGRRGLAGSGVAFSIELPRSSPSEAARVVADSFRKIDVEDDVGLPGCGPVAFGALPFDPAIAGRLVVPRLVVGRAEDGSRWVTAIGPDDTDPIDALAVRLRSCELNGATPIAVEAVDFSIRSSREPSEWCAAVAEAREAIRSGHARKVVLAREIVVSTSAPVSKYAVLSRLRTAYPGCYLYAVDALVGASPELLVARSGEIVRSHPMAGTAPRSGDPTTDARLAAGLLASTKDQEEHRITIDMVHDTLLPWCSYLDEEAEPSIVAIANVQHLATMVEGRLSSPPASVIELMTALHPTPAVCGHPREAALALIAKYEGLDRGAYAGPVGWVDAAGNGEWAVGIRCAAIDGTTARLYAGVGVVADSDPRKELAETQAKLQALLGAIIRP
ncbi:MAG: isochorismate synthase [Acidimicrobiales bacterium]|nr:isochorismate synthase [Acidimicrobiales bacterium]